MQITLSVVALLALLGAGSELSITIEESPFFLRCVISENQFDSEIKLYTTNEPIKVLKSGDYWIASRISGSKIFTRKYDDKNSSEFMYEIRSISGYSGNKELVAFHAYSSGADYVYWRELTRGNAYRNGLLGFSGDSIFPICSTTSVRFKLEDMIGRQES